MKPSPIINPSQLAARGNEARAALLSVLAAPVWCVKDEAHAALLASATQPMERWRDDYEDEVPEYIINPEGVAIVPVTGVLLDREPTWWMNYYGASSIPHIGRMVAEAYEDSRAIAVALYVDSPGGHASGIATVADIIWNLKERGEKPLITMAKEICSASYHLGSQTERIVITQECPTGCIGTVIIAADWSKFYADMGVTVNRITSTGGETYKGAGAYGTELTKEQKDDWKRVCDESQDLFNAHVARGRGMELSEAIALADGRYYIGANALPLHLADNVMSVEEALSILATGAQWPDQTPPANPPTPDPGPADDDNDEDVEAARKRQGAKGNLIMTAQELLARFQGKPKNEEKPPTEETTISAELAAMLESLSSAGITTSDQLTTTLRDAANGRKAMEARRKEAESVAVKAFGQNTDRLERAKKAIASATDFDDLQNLQAVYEEQIPDAFKNPSGRQTVTEPVEDKEESASVVERLNKVREEGQKANNTAPK